MSTQRSVFAGVPTAPKDVMFGLIAAYRADNNPKKVDLGVGVYRDENSKLWILPSVKKAKEILHADPNATHEYLPVAGLAEYIRASQKLILGEDSLAIQEQRVVSLQTLSGTGALSLAAAFLSKYYPISRSKVYVSSPAYVNHIPIFREAGLETETYPYYSAQTKKVDIEALLERLRSIPRESIVLLHACAHNPTGVDPSKQQWLQIAQVMREKQHVPFFDSAYQGIGSGNLDSDASSVRHFIEEGFDAVFIAQSYAKNVGMYGERVGCLHVVLREQDAVRPVLSQFERLQRAYVSDPPAYGARIVSCILNDKQLFLEWKQDVQAMASRIAQMRKALRQELERRDTPGSWRHIMDQVGMFCYSGLSNSQVEALRDEYHVYLAGGGRINISGLIDSNVAYTAEAIDAVVRSSDGGGGGGGRREGKL